jgi:hypothetical protein
LTGTRYFVTVRRCNGTEIDMGRPPIGKTAMTGAERVRRYRLKHGADKPVTKPVTKHSTDNVAGKAALKAELMCKDREIARLKARVAELEARGEAMKASKDAPHATTGPKIQLSATDYKRLAFNIHPNRWDHLNNKELTKALNEAIQVIGTMFEAVKQETRREAEARARREAEDREWRAKRHAEFLRRQAAARKAAAKRKARS